MPGKLTTNRGGKEKEEIGVSGAGSTSAAGADKRRKCSIWPIWTEEELTAEKWDECGKSISAVAGGGAAGGGGGGGEGQGRRRKGNSVANPIGGVGKTPNDDDILLPRSLLSSNIEWVQPGIYIVYPNTPVIVAEPDCTEIDLASENQHLMHSELMCSIIGQLQALWHQRKSPPLATTKQEGVRKEWRPWNHIYNNSDHPVPLLNPQGKYCVKLFWMGSWRKITVTDQLPLRRSSTTTATAAAADGSENKDVTVSAGSAVSEPTEAGEKVADCVGDERSSREMLLPRTANTTELWPAIITKAILKVAALDYNGGREWSEFGDSSVIHMMTGWCPQVLLTRVNTEQMWRQLCRALPMWERPADPEHEQEERDRGAEREGDGERRESAMSTVQAGGRGSAIVMAEFTTARDGKPLTKAKTMLMNASLALLKENCLIASDFNPERDQACSMLITQVRDQPLEPPPKERPPTQAPEEHAWLGYSQRRHAPWRSRPPTPLPPRWVEVVPPFPVVDVDKEEGISPILEEQGGLDSSPQADSPRPVNDARIISQDANEGSGTNIEQGSKVKLAGRNRVWMKYEEFVKAFSSLEVFVSPSRFKFSHTFNDLSGTVDKVNTPIEETKSKSRASQSPANRAVQPGAEADDTNMLFVDVSEPAELHFVFTCLSNWREDHRNLQTDRKKSIGLKQRRISILNPSNPSRAPKFSVPVGPSGYTPAERTLNPAARLRHTQTDYFQPETIPELEEDKAEAKKNTVSALPFSSLPSTLAQPAQLAPAVAAVTAGEEEKEEEDKERVMSGTLVVEEFDWRSIESKLPALRLTTSGVNGALLRLDPGQHILKLHVKAPLGHHLAIFSDVDFVLTNEDNIYNHMHQNGMGYSRVYSGPIPVLQSNSWAIVFREVLTVCEAELLSFRLECPVANHLLRVVDNDTGREMPRIVHTTKPQLYTPNVSGYTLLCDMWTRAEAVTEGKSWRLRVISSSRELPTWEGQEGEGEEAEEKEGDRRVVGIAREFYVRETRDYCLPDRDDVMFRYSLKVSQDSPITVQLQTSKKDAFIKLEIMDGETRVAETQGRAHCFIPMYLLHCNTPSNEAGDDTVESSSTTSAHRYVLVATVLHNSWPIPDTAWPFLADIKAAEEEAAEKLVVGGGGGGGKSGGRKPLSATKVGKGKKPKGGGGGGKEGAGGKDSGGEGLQSSVSLTNVDVGKPHWILRMALKQSDKEWFEMCKDREKEEELQSMEAAWETQQPGRLKKGQESRQKFLNAHALKDSTAADEDHISDPSTDLQSTLASEPSITSSAQLSTTSPLQPPHGPVPLQRIDLSPYVIHSHPTPHVLTAEERSRREEERRDAIRQYRAWRHAVLQSRDQDRQLRNEEKLRQLEEAEKQQADLERTRKRMNRGREKIRERCLAEEKTRREAEMAAQRPADEEVAGNARDSKAKGKKGKKK